MNPDFNITLDMVERNSNNVNRNLKLNNQVTKQLSSYRGSYGNIFNTSFGSKYGMLLALKNNLRIWLKKRLIKFCSSSILDLGACNSKHSGRPQTEILKRFFYALRTNFMRRVWVNKRPVYAGNKPAVLCNCYKHLIPKVSTFNCKNNTGSIMNKLKNQQHPPNFFSSQLVRQ
jgi:hypothetical protein